MKEELLKGLTNEQITKFKGCKNQDEILSLAKEEGIELTNEQLEAVSGGCTTKVIQCPKCGTTDVYSKLEYSGYSYYCNKCGFQWNSNNA